MSQSQHLTDDEQNELNTLSNLARTGVELTVAQGDRCEALAKRLRIRRPPAAPVPGQLPEAIKINKLVPTQCICGDPGVGGAPIA